MDLGLGTDHVRRYRGMCMWRTRTRFSNLIFEIFQVLFLFLFFGCDTATQLARQLYQERTQVLLCFISGVRRKEAEL